VEDEVDALKRIAAEEAFATPDLLAAYRRLLEHPPDDLDPGFRNLVGYYLTNQHPRALLMSTRIQDIGERRLADMDASGIDMQILGITAPGVQIFDATTGTALARSANDQLAEAIGRHPDRFAGLAPSRRKTRPLRRRNWSAASPRSACEGRSSTHIRTANTWTTRSSGRFSKRPKRSTCPSTFIPRLRRAAGSRRSWSVASTARSSGSPLKRDCTSCG
jgi:hypothetical protein